MVKFYSDLCDYWIDTISLHQLKTLNEWVHVLSLQMMKMATALSHANVDWFVATRRITVEVHVMLHAHS